MQRKVALLTTSTALAFAAALVTATPAQARNIGGIGGACTISPATVLGARGSNGAGQGAYCLCVIEPYTGQVVAGVNGPGTTCPPGILRLQPPATKPAG